MAQKVHPIGYRLGIPLRGSLAMEAAYGEGRVRGLSAPDLRGPRARWTSASSWTSGDWTQRDRLMEKQLREWLLLDGRMRNHLKMVRGAAGTSMSVDAYEVSDANLMLGLLPLAPVGGLSVDAAAPAGVSEPVESSDSSASSGSTESQAPAAPNEPNEPNEPNDSGVPAALAEARPAMLRRPVDGSILEDALSLEALEARAFPELLDVLERPSTEGPSTGMMATAATAGAVDALESLESPDSVDAPDAESSEAEDAEEDALRLRRSPEVREARLEPREALVSRHMERGRPVTLRRSLLNEVLPLESSEGESSSTSSFAFDEDLKQLGAMRAKIPAAKAFSHAVALRRSQGRPHQPVMRACEELLRGVILRDPTDRLPEGTLSPEAVARQRRSEVEVEEVATSSGLSDSVAAGASASASASGRSEVEANPNPASVSSRARTNASPSPHARPWPQRESWLAGERARLGGNLEDAALLQHYGRDWLGRVMVDTPLPGLPDPAAPAEEPVSVPMVLLADPRRQASKAVKINPNSRVGYYGYRFQVKGRMAGSERFRTTLVTRGARPRQTLAAGMDHGFAQAESPSGRISVQRSLCYA